MHTPPETNLAYSARSTTPQWPRPLTTSLLLLLLSVSTLMACSKPEHPAAPQATAAQSAPAVVASARGRVDIEGGVIRLAARRDGVISSVLVEEGARVKAGQVLATLDTELAQRNLDLTQRELAQTAHDVHKARVELAAARREVLRLEPLTRDDTIPRQDLDRAQDTLNLARVAVQAGEAATNTARAKQRVAASELEERKVVAPLDGEIIQRQARPGNGVSTTNVTPLFLFAPDAPRLVRAELDEQHLGVVWAGQPAEIILEAQPEQTWAGKVLRIGRVVGARTPSDDPTEKQDNRVVEVVVAIEGTQKLLIGQRVIVRFAAK
jgi:RND family efflux transporter MFP subunit